MCAHNIGICVGVISLTGAIYLQECNVVDMLLGNGGHCQSKDDKIPVKESMSDKDERIRIYQNKLNS